MNKTVLIMGGALVVAVALALIIGIGMSGKAKPVAQAAPKLEVLVASKLLLAGQKIAVEDVHWKVWPEDLVYNGLIKKADQPDITKLSYIGSPLRYDIESDQPVTTGAIISGKGSLLSAYIAPGMRAVAINVRADTMAGGFIVPDDHVDVILAFTPKLVGPAAQQGDPNLMQRQATELVLSDVKVLAVDQDIKSEAAKVARTVTLEVTPEGARKIALASEMGTLFLSLRHLGEKDDPNAKPTPFVTDVNVSQVIQELNAHAGDKEGDVPQVRLYSGNAVYNIPVRPNMGH